MSGSSDKASAMQSSTVAAAKTFTPTSLTLVTENSNDSCNFRSSNFMLSMLSSAPASIKYK